MMPVQVLIARLSDISKCLIMAVIRGVQESILGCWVHSMIHPSSYDKDEKASGKAEMGVYALIPIQLSVLVKV